MCLTFTNRQVNTVDGFHFSCSLHLHADSQGCSLFVMVLQAKEKSYVQSFWQPTSTPNFFSTLLLIKDILNFPGCPERGSQWRQLSLYVMLVFEEAALHF